MSEQKERGDVIQALNELVESTRLGSDHGVRAANKRLDAMNVSQKTRAAALRADALGDPEPAEPDQDPDQDVRVIEESRPVTVVKELPAERKAPGPSAKA
jgi:hypothetical protein